MIFLDAASSLGVSPKLGIGALKVWSSPSPSSLVSLSSLAVSSKLLLLLSEGDPGEGAPPPDSRGAAGEFAQAHATFVV